MVDIKRNFHAVLIVLAATVAMTLIAATPVFAQNKGGVPDYEDVTSKGGGYGWHECTYGSGSYAFAFDLSEDSIHYDGIVWTLCKGVMAINTESNFRPRAPVTRAETASALLRLYEERTGASTGHCGPSGGRAPQPFNDVEEGALHSLDIVQAWCLGIIEGVTADRFNPDGSLTRAQAASAVLRTLDAIWKSNYGFTFGDYVTECIDPWFTDVELGSAHGMAINRLACAGIVQGVSAGIYLPQGALTRDQLASILYDTADRRNWKKCCIE